MANSCPWGVGSKTKTFIAFESNYGEKLLPLHLITNHYITNDKKNRNPIIPNGKSMSGNKCN